MWTPWVCGIFENPLRLPSQVTVHDLWRLRGVAQSSYSTEQGWWGLWQVTKNCNNVTMWKRPPYSPSPLENQKEKGAADTKYREPGLQRWSTSGDEPEYMWNGTEVEWWWNTMILKTPHEMSWLLEVCKKEWKKENESQTPGFELFPPNPFQGSCLAALALEKMNHIT